MNGETKTAAIGISLIVAVTVGVFLFVITAETYEYIAPIQRVDYYGNRVVLNCPSDKHNPTPWVSVSGPILLLAEPGQQVRYRKGVNVYGVVLSRRILEIKKEKP